MITQKKKSLVGLAKSGTATAKKPVARKPAAKKPAARKPAAKKEPVLTPEQIRNQKAKARVDELLEGVDLSLEKKDELLELDETPEAGDSNNVEWLQDQLMLLSQANDQLKSDLEAARIGGPAPNDAVKQSVIGLFNELQENHLKLGTNPQTGLGNFRIYCPGFLNRLIKFFPFLAEHKRY